MERPERVNVHDVAQILGVELSNDVAWVIGSTPSRQYEQETGKLPTKALRPKKNGGGTHCFAVYNWTPWAKRIADLIRQHDHNRKRQGDLFD